MFVYFLILLSNVESAKILGIFPVPALSHFILGSSLMKGLAERGHEITFISPFVEKNLPKNGIYKEIILTGFLEERNRRSKEVNMFDRENLNPFLMTALMSHMLLDLTERTLNHTNVQKLIHSNEEFDVVIVDVHSDAHKAFAPHFRTPLISFSTIAANAWVNLLVGNPAPPSYVPALFLSYSSSMSFYERCINSLMYPFAEALHRFYMYPRQNRMVQKYFPNAPDLGDIIYNASIVLLNSHPSTNQPIPYVPNMIDVGGFFVKTPQRLPEDLQEFLDDATDGAIYFSLGSNLKSSDLPKAKREAFLKTFAKLKEKVLWKWEDDLLPGQPPNVKLGKWLPQQDILAHPNIKLFITHGGLLSTTETISHGVPVLAIPVFGDQKLNSQRIVNEGFGLTLSYQEITEEKLESILRELLTNPSYANNAKKKSVIFHDRIATPMDTAVYWVEYVIRHRGAPHLKVAGVELPWYQYLLLDVVLCVSLVSLLASYMLYLIFKKSIVLWKCQKVKLKQM